MMFTKRLREGVRRGDITCSVRIWVRPHVRVGGRYRMEEVLGERQDTFLTRPLCTQLGLQAFAAGENAWTWGRLHALEQARCERAEQEFWVRWPQLRPVLRSAVR